jgi:uncharacterized protein (TIGR03000 family)
MTPGQNYAYDIRARWTQNGQPVEVTRTIQIQANDQLRVDLTKSSTPPEAAPESRDNTAHLQIRSPGPDTEIWLNGVRTRQTGAEQQYRTPPMTTGQQFSYEIRGRWTENGKPVEVTKTVLIQAKDQLTVDLAQPSRTASK